MIQPSTKTEAAAAKRVSHWKKSGPQRDGAPWIPSALAVSVAMGKERRGRGPYSMEAKAAFALATTDSGSGM
jgi:hypothetical protein